MKNWYFSQIKNEILFWFLLVSILPLLFISLLYFLNLKSDFEENTKKYLTQILNKKVEITNNYIRTLENQLETTALLPVTKNYLKEYKENFENNKIEKKYKVNPFFKKLISKYEYYDMFLIDIDGNIIYSVKKESDLYENLTFGSLKESVLAKVFEQSKKLLSTQISTFSYYEPSKSKSCFMTTPIFNEDKIAGILAFQISEKKLFDMIINYDGLGTSGEIVAGYFDKDKNIISAIPLRHNPNAFKDNFILQSNTLSKNKIPVRDAIAGKNGAGVAKDYRDIKIYAAWKHVSTLGWGMVIKIDYSEIMRPVYNRTLINMLILFFVILFISIAIILITKHIVNPIQILTQKVKDLSNDKIDKIVDENIELDNEIGILLRSFNKMSNSLYESQKTLKEYTTQLESRVKRRTNELQISKEKLEKANEEMKKNLDLVDKYVIASATDINGRITEVSEALCTISGYTKDELIGKKHGILRHPDTDESLYKNLWQTVKRGETWRGEIKNLKKDGSYYWVDAVIAPVFDKNGNIKGYNSVRQNITDRKRAEKLSITDQLTKIYNRVHLEESFKEELNRAKRYNSKFSIILLDVDHFKEVNDNYGHDIGDEILIDMAKILQKHIRATDILGRWGGEEFLIILPETDVVKAEQLAEKLRVEIENHTFVEIGKKTSSFGVSEFKIDDESSKEIVKRADNALYEAKNLGRNRVVVSK